MRKILVTGASGHLGRHVVPLLAQQNEVYVFSRKSSNETDPAVIFRQVDVFDVDRVEQEIATIRPECLLHLAWQEQGPAYLSSPEHDLWAQASNALYQAFSRHGGQRAALAGSVYELTLPNSAYSIAKRRLRDQVLAAAEKGGASAVWCRVYGTYGPGDRAHKFIPSAIAARMKGTDLRPQNPDELWDYVYVSDVCRALIASLESDFRGIVDIASGKSISLGNLYRTLCDLHQAACEGSGCVQPPPLVATVPPVGRELSEQIGWKQKYDLCSGLQATIDSYRRSAGIT